MEERTRKYMSVFQFVKLRKDHLDMVYKWRTSEFVSRFMLTRVSGSIQDHYAWFDIVDNDHRFSYWVIIYKEVPIGIINLAAIDPVNLKLTAGYYIGESEYLSLGAVVLPYLYNYVFLEMKYHKIYGEVVAGNNNVLKIHMMHGYRNVGTYKDHLIVNGSFQDVMVIELLSDEWFLKKRYKHYIAEFII